MKTIRLFGDDGVQTEIASDTGNEMTVACMDILGQLEEQLGELVDLRDLDDHSDAAVVFTIFQPPPIFIFHELKDEKQWENNKIWASKG